jgi:ATP-dependent DNA helicase DinG
MSFMIRDPARLRTAGDVRVLSVSQPPATISRQGTSLIQHDLLAHFPAGCTPRAEQARLLARVGDAIAEALDDPQRPRIFVMEAPPGVGKSHVAMTLARWSGDAYLLTSQKLLQDQYERDFAGEIQVVKGRDNYLCERYPERRVPTSLGMCRWPRGPQCQCPYARAKAAARAGPVFCTNTAYFATLRHWLGESLPRRRLLVIDEAHNLESQLVGALSVTFSPDQMREWFGAPLPRLPSAHEYRPLLRPHVERLGTQLTTVERALDTLRPPGPDAAWFSLPPSREELQLVAERDRLETGLAGLRYFVDSPDPEWAVRYPASHGSSLELLPLGVADLTPTLLWDAADIIVLSSAYLGPPAATAGHLGFDAEQVRVFAVDSPFPLEQRPLVYRPVGRLSRATLGSLEPLVFAEVITILRRHASEKGLIHTPSYGAAHRLSQALAEAAPDQFARLIVVEGGERTRALDVHRALRRPSVLVSPSLREGVDLPDDFLRFQIITKMPYPDLGDPWTAARRQRDPRWYILETAKALVQAYGRSCRHAADYGVTYMLDAQFERFVGLDRVLLPEWFLEAADAALRAYRDEG